MPDRDTILGGAAVLSDKTKVNHNLQPSSMPVPVQDPEPDGSERDPKNQYGHEYYFYLFYL
jgi:hypothetical protein